MKGNSKCCIKMNGPTTVITDPATRKDKPFTFDYSFWSHDDFIDVDGVSRKTNDNSIYADQDVVYENLGK